MALNQLELIIKGIELKLVQKTQFCYKHFLVMNHKLWFISNIYELYGNSFEIILKRNYCQIRTSSRCSFTSYRHRSTTGSWCIRWVRNRLFSRIFITSDTPSFTPLYNIFLIDKYFICKCKLNLLSERVMQTSKECISWLCWNYGFIESKSSNLEKRNLRWRLIKMDSQLYRL